MKCVVARDEMKDHEYDAVAFELASHLKDALLGRDSARAKAITRDIGVFVAKGIMPFSVENTGFNQLMSTLEPKYHIASL